MAIDENHQARLLGTLKEANLVPGSASALIPADFKPRTQLNISFGGKKVDLGNLFRVSEVKTAPSISFETEADNTDEKYLLMLVDPDAPTPDDPKFAFWRHWVLSGLQANGSAAARESKPALTEYLAPGPKDDSKPHRYLFLLFREPEGFAIGKDDVGGEEFVQRRSFPAEQFIDKHGLKLVGVNWMLGAGDGWAE